MPIGDPKGHGLRAAFRSVETSQRGAPDDDALDAEQGVTRAPGGRSRALECHEELWERHVWRTDWLRRRRIRPRILCGGVVARPDRHAQHRSRCRIRGTTHGPRGRHDQLK